MQPGQAPSMFLIVGGFGFVASRRIPSCRDADTLRADQATDIRTGLTTAYDLGRSMCHLHLALWERADE